MNKNTTTELATPGMMVLATLIMGAAVANMNLSVANVALPSIGLAFDASQVNINLVSVGFPLGLAASVLWFGALGDRYGRKMMLLLGTFLAMPAAIIAGFAPTIEVLILARIFGGLAAGMAFPTTLALIAAIWSGSKRVRAIALWSGIGAAISAIGPMIAGFLLLFRNWGSVFLITLPLAVVALIMIYKFIPANINETEKKVDNLGGALSLLFLGGLILAINFAPATTAIETTIVLAIIALVSGIFFIIRQHRVKNPLFDIKIARRPTFMIAALGGIIVFGSLIGSMYVGQQFMQNVLNYSTLNAGIAILPVTIFMVLVAPSSARLVERFGSRFTLLFGFFFCFLGFLVMLFLWTEGIPYWIVGLAYGLIGLGVGIAGTPASDSLTSSVPVERVGMASGTADLQRDFGGAIMTSIFGVLLTAGYYRAFDKLIVDLPTSEKMLISNDIVNQLLKSFSSAADLARIYPHYQDQIITAAKTSFLTGSEWAHLAGVIAILIGAAIVYFKFPKKEEEKKLHEEYRTQDKDF